MTPFFYITTKQRAEIERQRARAKEGCACVRTYMSVSVRVRTCADPLLLGCEALSLKPCPPVERTYISLQHAGVSHQYGEVYL